MSKFNQKTEGKHKTTNRNGWEAYAMEIKEHLVTVVLTSMINERKYYGSTDDELFELVDKLIKDEPDFIAKLACYSRNEGNLRSVSHVLAAIIAHDAKDYTKQVIDKVVVRPDDILEIMSCYKTLYGKPFPNALKRAIAKQMNRFNEYNIAKYKSTNKGFNFKDVLRICHPVPINEEKQIIFNHIINDTLETPYTWETELSAKGNNKEVWNELIASDKLGYMAKLRNLRNMFRVEADVEKVLESISERDAVKNSKQFPFRFYSAYRELACSNRDWANKARPYIDKCLEYSVVNLPVLNGRTLIAVDISGSMSMTVSDRSAVTCADIAKVFACLSNKLCEDATVVYFSSSYFNHSGITVKKYGKYDSVLKTIESAPSVSGGTEMSLPILWALNDDTSDKPFDRIIYFSDNECNSGRKTVQSWVNKYKNKFNCDPWVHAVDLCGYGTQQFYGKKFNLIAGWSDAVIPFIHIAENGIGNLVSVIENYSLS